ncbi:LacI family transcriptional regulator [Kineosphaera limosa]|uniref:Putative LacI family transcriptional regulator n=1 Tax=Kineosphaera limosa NBRC 100340 TaxID=1184609 RepID=K6WXR3_9MICO|nr:LacI family DNA-binding transcriptional regulator [Kineosphaera limosa]NYE00305.1 LacI family transcriptional regulator [Kineosphaera limosa]GAB96867.1 putative LacI family transcriptional regulator [Kineosphaera limosa NBRC 100340]
MSAVTMTMVAKQAGVSVSTVSHVINGTRPVAGATKQRVLATMDELGFTHKPVARSLAAGSTTTIGLSMSWVSSMYGQELVAGIEEECLRQGMQLLLADTRDDEDREERAVANLLAHHVGGMLVAPTARWHSATLRLLQEHSVPYVVIDRLQDMRVDQVGVENESGSSSVVEHLLQIGHRRVAAITGREGLATTRERLAGYRLAHRRRGLRVDERLVVSGGSTEQGGRRAMAQLLASGPAPTGVFISNDSMSIGALRALQEAGISVPGQMAVVCFDDFPWGDVFHPRLTTIAQPSFAIGARAVQLLVRRLSDPQAPAQTLRLAGEVTHRESCGCNGQGPDLGEFVEVHTPNVGVRHRGTAVRA